jgi:hypothetical protein
MASQTITIGMQTSGDDSATGKHVVELRGLMASCCNGPYSGEIDEFALIVRVGGCMQEFDFPGCEHIRRSRKQRYIQVDLAFPSQEWRGKDAAHIREFLVKTVEVGLHCCLDRLLSDGVEVAREQLLADFDHAKRLFLEARH